MFQTFENTSAILKLRLSVLTIVNVLIIATYCQAGQKIFNEVWLRYRILPSNFQIILEWSRF
jgi:hypothetical protein